MIQLLQKKLSATLSISNKNILIKAMKPSCNRFKIGIVFVHTELGDKEVLYEVQNPYPSLNF